MSSSGTASVADWLVQNRDKIEKGVRIMGQASEVLASTVGQLHPVLEAVFVAAGELLGDPDGQEARYLTRQLEEVGRQLEGIQDEIDRLALELQRTGMNKQNFHREAQMLSQYEKFQDFVNAAPKFKQKKMEKFLSHYENTEADLNLDALYNAATGRSAAGDPMLDTVVATERRSRRAVEDFCARLKKLFVVGIIAVMGHAALRHGAVGQDTVTKWQRRMEEVEERMKAAVDECKEKFPEQARADLEHLLQECPAQVDQDLTKSLLDALVQKYDWVCWSIRAFGDRERIFFFNWLAGKKYHGRGGGANSFSILTKSKVNVVVSFCVDPKPVNKREIQEQIEQQKLKGNMMDVAGELSKRFPDCLVHAVSHYKAVLETNNFQEDCYYYGKHKKAYLCIHPE